MLFQFAHGNDDDVLVQPEDTHHISLLPNFLSQFDVPGSSSELPNNPTGTHHRLHTAPPPASIGIDKSVPNRICKAKQFALRIAFATRRRQSLVSKETARSRTVGSVGRYGNVEWNTKRQYHVETSSMSRRSIRAQ